MRNVFASVLILTLACGMSAWSQDLSADYLSDAAFVTKFREEALAIARRKMQDVEEKRLQPENRPVVPLGPRIATGGHFGGLFVWDSAFAVLWARHAPEGMFPIHSTLDNFYLLQQPDGFICREYDAKGRPCWRDSHPVSLNPPILSWAEATLWRERKSDVKRLERIYPALVRFHDCINRCFRRADGLYFGDALGCGMDDLPRLPVGRKSADCKSGGIPLTQAVLYPHNTNWWSWLERRKDFYSWNRQAGWIDISAQMALDCLSLAELADGLGRKEEAVAWRSEHGKIAAAINAKCWDEKRGFYFDCTDDGVIPRYHAGALWTLLARVPNEDQARRMLSVITDPERFNRPCGLPALAKGEPEYAPETAYWCGVVWPPTTYMAIHGLLAYGFKTEAQDLARRWYNANAALFEKTGTVWENISPEQCIRPKKGSGRDFCGWSALAPVAIPAEFGLERGRPVAVANVINFVRGLDPRTSRAELKRTLEEEVRLNLKHGFKNTILFQYDALLDDDFVSIARKSDPEKTEFGVWFELCQPLVEKAGIPWNCTKPGWQWDWHIDPGFLMAYAPEERCRIIDEVFARFKSIFGRYPTVAGSWLIDAHSMDYMARHYGMDGFCICREQDSTDAYGLRGGYSNGAYYPSRKNMLSAATDMANAIPVPVFKILTADPIYNYARPQHLYPDYPDRRGCPTLEPAWLPGFTPSAVDWYFRIFTRERGLMNLSYMQLGQENSFSWKEVSKGLPYQFEKLSEAVREGSVTLETFGETARRFKREHPRNCPQTQVALDDWTGKDRKSVWYNCANYRANLFFDAGHLALRDIHVMRDDFAEPYLTKPCKSWRALYYTPPVFDQILATSNACFRPLVFGGRYRELKVSGDGREKLSVEAVRDDGCVSRFAFDENGIGIENVDCDWPRFLSEVQNFRFEGYSYAVRCQVREKERRIRFSLRPDVP